MYAIGHRALDGEPDGHPEDDVCPRLPTGIDPFPDGAIDDKGYGTQRGDGTFGDPVNTDVASLRTEEVKQLLRRVLAHLLRR